MNDPAPIPPSEKPATLSMAEQVTDLYNDYLVPTYAPGLVLVKGKGCQVWDAEGKSYLDFVAGIAVNTLGHAHPAWLKAIRKQAGKLAHVSNLYFSEPQAQLARELSHLSLGGKCFFCNSGAEANEALIKLARRWGADRGQYEIISLHNSFHGRTLATLTATGQQKVKTGFDPLPAGFVHADFNNLESLRSAVTSKTAAILIETVQGEGGVLPADPEFMRGLTSLCKEFGILLLIDEVQTGIGRTGEWFGYQHYGLEPDAISLAKGLGGGLPIGALVTSQKLADVLQPGSHGSTFGGNPLSCAAALAVLGTIRKKNLVAHAKKMGALFCKRLEKTAGKYAFIQEVRGQGLLLGVAFDRDAKELERILARKGLIVVATAGNVIRMLPPLTVTASEIRKAARMFDKACAEWQEYQKSSEPVEGSVT